MSDPKPLVVWTTCHPWIQDVVAEVQPEGFDTAFVDLADDAAVADLLPPLFINASRGPTYDLDALTETVPQAICWALVSMCSTRNRRRRITRSSR